MTTVRRTTTGSIPIAGGATPLLSRGSHGPSVEALQRALQAAGFDAGAADGDFGPRTEAAVKAFQRSVGLSPDGVVGPRTQAALANRSAPAPAPKPAPAPSPSGSGLSPTGPVLRQGSRGREVVELQRALAAAGFSPGAADGDFGAKTRAAVIAFQRSRGLAADGVVGPRTRAALTRPDSYEPSPQPTPQPSGSARLAPRTMNERQKYDFYAALVRANGGAVNPGGTATVLGLRGVTLDGATHESTSAARYDDVFVVLTADGRAIEFSGATHPGQNSSRAAPDVTGDGSGDVGTIKPGNYLARPNGEHSGDSSWHVVTTSGSGRIPGWRDTNHDGRFSEGERASSDRRGDGLTGVLFHRGNPSAPSSIGCQTLSPADYTRFIQALGGRNASFSYTLVDAQ